MNLNTVELKAFIPAKDFARSCEFYEAVGFTCPWHDEDLAYFHHANCSFLLQNHHVQACTENFMMHLLVENVDDWHAHVTKENIAARFSVRIDAPIDQPWKMRDFVMFDPSGVLWRIAQNT